MVICGIGGIFLFKAGAFLEELQKFSPDTVELCREAVRDGSGEGEVFKPKIEPFLRCVSDSIDFAVMEKTEPGGGCRDVRRLERRRFMGCVVRCSE